MTDAGVAAGSAGFAAKTRVAILGGGGGGVAAAFWLSSTEENRERFEVTLYNRGWRLGGKAASGRKMTCGARIEEHGLHMLMGCYQNAFHTIRECYKAWQPPPDNRFKKWQDAFQAEREVLMWEGSAEDIWAVTFPQWGGSPGDGNMRTLEGLLHRLVDWLKTEMLNARWMADQRVRNDAHIEFDQISNLLIWGNGPFADSLAADALLFLQELNRAVDPQSLSRDLRHLWILIDLGLAVAKGILLDVLPNLPGGLRSALDDLNEMDFRDWLRSHGADEESVTSAPINTLYDLTFAFLDGDPAQADIAAGVTLLFALEFVLDYRDAPLWRMRAGMGDTIFTPFYQVLQARGVDIKLFHALREVQPAEGGTSVARVVLDRQADFVHGHYDPFVRVKNLDCWPDEPLWDQLVDGETLKADHVNFESVWDTTSVGPVTLEAGRDFDIVILAVPPEMQKIVAPALGAPGTSYEEMLERSVSIPTQSTQLWLTRTTAEICDYDAEPLMSNLSEPYDSWADMSELLAAEDWPPAKGVKSIQYLCNVMAMPPGSGDPIGAGNNLAQTHAQQWLTANANSVWPGSGWPLAPGSGPSPVASSYFRGNVEPSELYVQTPAGTVKSRLGACESGYDNLVLAGDWTRTRYSGGCFESAIESGMLASRCISGVPAHIAGDS